MLLGDEWEAGQMLIENARVEEEVQDEKWKKRSLKEEEEKLKRQR